MSARLARSARDRILALAGAVVRRDETRAHAEWHYSDHRANFRWLASDCGRPWRGLLQPDVRTLIQAMEAAGLYESPYAAERAPAALPGSDT